MDVPTAIAQVLKEEGVDYLFAYPLNPLIEAAAEADIRPIIVRQERVGIHMADAVSRVTSGEEIGVFCMQKGPGAENAFGGVAQAHADSVPIVVLPMGFERDATHQAPNFDASVNYREITKSIERVEDPDSAVGAVRRAFNQARNGRPRPTLVELPRDVLQSEVGDTVDYTPTRTERPAPDPTAVPAVADAILAAEHPASTTPRRGRSSRPSPRRSRRRSPPASRARAPSTRPTRSRSAPAATPPRARSRTSSRRPTSSSASAAASPTRRSGSPSPRTPRRSTPRSTRPTSTGT